MAKRKLLSYEVIVKFGCIKEHYVGITDYRFQDDFLSLYKNGDSFIHINKINIVDFQITNRVYDK